jgi:hypothetical protein
MIFSKEFEGSWKVEEFHIGSAKICKRELPSTSFFGGTKTGGVERQNFNPKINIKFTFTTNHRTLLLLLLRYKMAPGMCLSLLP